MIEQIIFNGKVLCHVTNVCNKYILTLSIRSGSYYNDFVYTRDTHTHHSHIQNEPSMYRLN